jgi:glycosyltransferase involved in cell wall biosynthesis
MGLVEPAFFDIGVLTYNNAETIGDSLESLISQSFKDWSATIYDDCSNDKTEMVVAPFLTDKRIKYKKQKKNIGQAMNWAAFLNRVASPYAAVLHADDYWTDDFLEIALQYINKFEDVDIVFRNWKRCADGKIDSEPTLQGKSFCRTGLEELEHQLESFTILPSATVLSRKLIDKIKPPNPGYQMIVDGDYMIRAVATARYICFEPEPGVIYRVHSKSATSQYTRSGRFDDERVLLYNELGNWLLKNGISEELVGKLGVQMANGLITSAKANAKRGRFAYAKKRFDDADRLLKGGLSPFNKMLRSMCAVASTVASFTEDHK